MRAVDVQAARTYHDETKHSVERLQRESHFLDWETLPTPYKLYTAIDPEPLPRDWPPTTEPAIAAIAGGATAYGGAADATAVESRTPTAADVARLLLLTAGITRHVVYANGRETYFRAAACTGALYHVDLYVVCGALAGLDAGVYHFGPQDFALRRLRDGDHRAVLIAASGDEPAVARAAVIVVLASTVWRNAWKYRARAYRHVFWDGGTLAANALAAAAAAKLAAHVVCGFADTTVQRLVGVDGERELPFALLAIGDDRGPRAPVPPMAPIAPDVAPVSVRETAYPAIPAVHRASSLETAEEVRAWRTRAIAANDHDGADPAAARIPLRPLRDVPDEPIDAVIRRRGSTRVFDRGASIAFEELSTILVTATRPFAADFLADATAHLCELFLVVHAVDGLAPGTYAHDRRTQALELLRGGDFRREAGFLALGQDLAADASVDCYVLADLTRIFGGLGNRGYRCAQLEGGVVGGRIYLAAYALRLGATGLTFFDDAVVDFFGPRAAGKDVMFLAAIGRGRREHGR